MPKKFSANKNFLFVLALALTAHCLTGSGLAQDAEKPTTEPVYRVGRNNSSDTLMPTANESAEAPNANNAVSATPVAPMDKALDIAQDGLEHIQKEIRDYTAIMIKRERIGNVVGDAEFIQIKVRNAKPDQGIPFSIYMNFLKPSAVKGREVIYVEGQNDGKLIAHESPNKLIGKVTARLDPNGFIAMKGNRYPIQDAGIENLVAKLIEKGTRERGIDGLQVKFYEQTKINGRDCTMIQVTHPEKRVDTQFHICRIFIDKELNIPIRYAAYGWPAVEGGKPSLEEEYTYLKVAINVGLTDQDFDPKNPSYKYPR